MYSYQHSYGDVLFKMETDYEKGIKRTAFHLTTVVMVIAISALTAFVMPTSLKK